MDSEVKVDEITDHFDKVNLNDENKDEEEAKYNITLLYDESVNRHCANEGEIPTRCKLVYDKLEESKVLVSKKLTTLPFTMITLEDLAKIHTQSHIEKVMSCEKLLDDEVTQIFEGDTYECKFTPECARLAAGSALEGMKDVLSSTSPVKSAFCLIRPPGHHAPANNAAGYCFFNNAAIAAHFAKELYGLKRVCIFDWDVHHGDGTQDIFYETDEVLFISIHRHEHGKFYPWKEESACTYIGKDKGEGYNINVAWNTVEKEADETLTSEKEYKFLCENLLFGIVKEYDPELIIISAGYDSGKGDPLGKQQVKHEAYHWMAGNLQRICPKILLLLEGGYNMETLAICATYSVQALMGYGTNCTLEEVTKEDVLKDNFDCILNTAKAHAPYWKTAQEFVDKYQ